MLDLNYVRENLESVRAALEKRSLPATALNDFTRADAERRQVIAESDQLNAERNTASREIGALMKDGKRAEADTRRKAVNELKDRIAKLDQKREQAEARIHELLTTLPNIPHESVPVGKDESANVEARRWGTKPEFDFAPKDHVDLGTALGILDLERASLFGTGQLPKFAEDLFQLEDERALYLRPTAEVPVTNYYREEILEASQLPMKWVAYTPCFRSEAGSYGKD